MQLHYIKNAEEMVELGKKLAYSLQPGAVLYFFGELGAGKTTLIKGIARALQIDPRLVSSPTFQYLNIYVGKYPLFHFDLYRLTNHDDFLALGFDEQLEQGGIACIEWSERITAIIPKNACRITISHTATSGREIKIEHEK